MTGKFESQSHTDDHALLRAVLDNAVDGVLTIDETGTVEAVNPAAETLFGYSAAELIGRNVKMLMPSPYHEEHDGYLANYGRTGERKIIGVGREAAGRRKDGSVFPLYLAVSEVSLGHRKVFTGFVHDLTELRKAEEQATHFGRILENSLNEIYIFESQSLQFLLVNRGALENIGYTADEMSQRTPLDIKTELNDGEFRDIIAPLVAGRQSVVQFETTHQRQDASIYDVHVRIQKTTWENRDAFVAIILDISDSKRVQRELAELNAELEDRVEQRTTELRDAQAQLVRREKLAVMGQLAGGVAHEIRNPLGVIRNAVYYLKMLSDQLDADGQECIREIEREVVTANGIVSELLDFTREPTSHIETFSATDAINNALRAAAVPDRVEVIIEGESSLRLNADQGQIERVLTNLIRNGCQAMPQEGQLTISKAADGDHAVIQVTDTGTGIPPEHVPQVFEPLFTTKAKGIGLGLAVSRRYAERNGGDLTFESEVGNGTTFRLSVPLSKS